MLDASQQQRIIAMVRSDPPEGHARWTVCLIAGQALVVLIGTQKQRSLVLQLKPTQNRARTAAGRRRASEAELGQSIPLQVRT